MKKWLKINIFLLVTFLMLVGGLNYFMDPLWCFAHSHKFNSFQKGANERQQKTNAIYFTSKQYDTLLLGSSRTAYMNRHSFTGMNVFNFSVSDMRPHEYLPYINFTINDSHQPIRTIILGVDFFGYLNYGSQMNDNAPNIIQATKSSLYRWKILFSYDATNYSIRNLRNYFISAKRSDFYNRDDVKMMVKRPVNTIDKQYNVISFTRNEYESQPNPNFKRILKTIKNYYNNKKFIIYTTPVSQPLFQQMIKQGHYQDYENWLRTLVNIYGTVNHFMYINSITKDYVHHFVDCGHVYPESNSIIARQITAQCKGQPRDFGMILTRENIEIKLQELRMINGVSK